MFARCLREPPVRADWIKLIGPLAAELTPVSSGSSVFFLLIKDNPANVKKLFNI